MSITKNLFRLFFSVVILAVVGCSFYAFNFDNNSSISISTIHGDLVIQDPLVIELINSQAMQRLKKIRQYGTVDYAMEHKVGYNRFDHSLGVYYILCKNGASRAEQIAGLLHDVSHTVFSHACDPLFMGDLTKGAYQDTIHDQFLTHYGIKDILSKYGLSVNDVMPKNKNFRALEQEAPALCADRIEYNIYAAYMDDLLSKEAIQKIYEQLHFDGHDWYFDNAETAKKFALIPMHQTVYMWSSPAGILVNLWTSQALKRALDLGLIEKEDIFFRLSDDEMWDKLNKCKDDEICSITNKIVNCNLFFSWAKDKQKEKSVVLKARFRGVDPYVKTNNGLVLLSTLDTEFKKDYDLLKKIMENGWPIVVHNEPGLRITKKDFDPRLQCASIRPLQNNNSCRFISEIG